jgi:hypothetical protein
VLINKLGRYQNIFLRIWESVLPEKLCILFALGHNSASIVYLTKTGAVNMTASFLRLVFTERLKDLKTK